MFNDYYLGLCYVIAALVFYLHIYHLCGLMLAYPPSPVFHISEILAGIKFGG